MSASMYWRPVRPKPEGTYVDDRLRHVLARRLWNQDGSLSASPDVLDENMIPYLEGVRDAGVPAAQELIDAIKKHEVVEVWIVR